MADGEWSTVTRKGKKGGNQSESKDSKQPQKPKESTAPQKNASPEKQAQPAPVAAPAQAPAPSTSSWANVAVKAGSSPATSQPAPAAAPAPQKKQPDAKPATHSPPQKQHHNQQYNKGGKGGKPGAGKQNPQEIAAKEKAAEIFGCSVNNVQTFINQEDPFNPSVKIDGAICRADGVNYGNMVITKLNDNVLEKPQIIFGTPKMEKLTPDNPHISATLSSEGNLYFFANKWNGENVSVFKYSDGEGKFYVSARPRGHAFIKDNRNVSPSFGLVYGFLSGGKDLPQKISESFSVENLPASLSSLASPNVQSVTFELCGTKVPELVKYEFPSEFKPLFVTDVNGQITPFGLFGVQAKDALTKFAVSSANAPEDSAPFAARLAFWSTDGPIGAISKDSSVGSQMTGFVKKFLSVSGSLNTEFRKEKGLSAGCYFGNFAIEGKVLYIVGPDMTLLNKRVIFKLKPKELDQNHSVIFDNLGQCKTIEALSKLYKKGESLTEENLRKEMDLSMREWNYFSKEIMGLVEGIPNVFGKQQLSKQKMLVLVGFPGSGKSTVANSIVQQSATLANSIVNPSAASESSEKKAPLHLSNWYRVNQDEMGSRVQCESRARDALLLGKSVVVDRCNFDIKQRSTWIKLAQEHNVNDIRCLHLDISPEICKSRVTTRENHPTIPAGSAGHSIIDKFVDQLVAPMQGEGFTSIITVHNDEELQAALQQLVPLAQSPSLSGSTGNSSGNIKKSGGFGKEASNPEKDEKVARQNAFALLAGGDDEADEEDE